MRLVSRFLAVVALSFLMVPPLMSQSHDIVMNCQYDANYDVGGDGHQAWVLPPQSGYVTLATYTLSTYPGRNSDALFFAQVSFSEDNPPQGKVIYRVKMDGSDVVVPAFVRRLPASFPHTHEVVGFIGGDGALGIGAGDHQFVLEVKNMASVNMYIYHVLLTVMYVHSDNDFGKGYDPDTVFSGSWKAVASAAITVPDNDHLVVLAGMTRVYDGEPNSPLEFRFAPAGGGTIRKWRAETPDVFTDGFVFSHIWDPGVGGTYTIRFQGRNLDGYATKAREAYVFAQVIPKYQLWDNSSGAPLSLPTDGQYHPIHSTESESVDSSSQGTNNWGFSLSVASWSPQPRNPADSLRMRLQQYNTVTGEWDGADNGISLNQTGDPAVIGTRVYGGGGYTARPSGVAYDLRILGQDLCSSGEPDIFFDNASVQRILLPSYPWFPYCGQQWRTCCAQASNCTYQCEGPSNLTVIVKRKYQCE
jgi:hypothetical protein